MIRRFRGWSLIMGATAAMLVLSACNRPTGAAAPQQTAAPLTKLTVAYSEITFNNLPVYLAKEAGIFERHGLDVDLQDINSSTAIAALVSGQVQIAHAGGSETLSANVGGADLVMVAMLGAVYPYWLMAQSSITSPDELRGKKIGISQPGSSSDVATRVVLRRFGLDPDQDVTLVPVGSLANRTAALLGGAIDAGLDSPPGALEQEKQGLHELIDVAALKLPATNVGAAVSRSYLDAHHDVIQRYVDSLMEAMAQEKADRDLSVKILKEYYKSDDDEAMSATYDFALETLPDVPYPKPEQFGDVLQQLQSKNDAVRTYDVSKMLDSSYVQNAVDRKVGASTN